MIQENELVNLVMGLAAVPAVFVLARHGQAPRLPLLYAGVVAVLGGYVFTVAEGFFWPSLFNLLEHLSLAASGVLFCTALARFPRDLERTREEPD